MGVFLSKPCIVKFSDDGEDESVGFGVSSMQGWRKNMEDAHVAELDLPAPETDTNSKIRLFGVFDGHGGKEVALFVQEHFAEELVKLDDFKGGDFPQALIRSFHRMDELLEGAAVELRQAHNNEGGEARVAETMERERVGSSGLERARAGGASAVDAERAFPSMDRNKAIVEELMAFSGSPEPNTADAAAPPIPNRETSTRSRRNPSDVETESSSPTGFDGASRAVNSLFGGGGDDFDSDDENETIAAGKRVAAVMGAGAGTGDGRGAIEVLPSRSSSGGSPGSSSNNASGNTAGVSDSQANNSNHKHRIKLTDALDMFHRILDLRSENRRAVAKRQTDAATTADAVADSAPPSVTTVTAAEGVDLAVTGFGASPAGGIPLAPPDEENHAANALVGEGDDGDSAACAVVDDDEGEDTFGDSESEEEDVKVTANGDGMRSRLGLGASLQSLVHGTGNGPTCTLSEHPIQAGCTSVVCLIVGKTLYVANAGDSRAVLCRGGIALEMSKDHKPMSEDEKYRIERAGGFISAAGRVNGNLNLSRSIGDLKYKANTSLPPADQMITAEPDIKAIKLEDGDTFIVLACDGVWDCMSSQECIDFIKERIGKKPLSKICEDVMDNCLSQDPRHTAGIGGDNMTCIVVLLDRGLGRENISAPVENN